MCDLPKHKEIDYISFVIVFKSVEIVFDNRDVKQEEIICVLRRNIIVLK